MREKELNDKQLEMLNNLAPEHIRYSCNEGETPMENLGRCDRCNMIIVALSGTECEE